MSQTLKNNFFTSVENLIELLPGEFNKVEHPVLDGSLLVHVVHLLVGEALAHGGQQLPEVVLVEWAWKWKNKINFYFHFQILEIEISCPENW